ncbi:MAG: DUF4214 domain-containing protein [Candidatus Doudnabacteria bacterium]|nr:DUF4214 domain-containing protein [Candidatus Doudnabacteria bacterium]
MEKIKIKRVKRKKKKITAKEKTLTGLGVAGALMGGISGVSPRSPQTKIVNEQSQQTGAQNSGGIKQKIKAIFGDALGVQTAKADTWTLPASGDYASQVVTNPNTGVQYMWTMFGWTQVTGGTLDANGNPASGSGTTGGGTGTGTGTGGGDSGTTGDSGSTAPITRQTAESGGMITQTSYDGGQTWTDTPANGDTKTGEDGDGTGNVYNWYYLNGHWHIQSSTVSVANTNPADGNALAPGSTSTIHLTGLTPGQPVYGQDANGGQIYLGTPTGTTLDYQSVPITTGQVGTWTLNVYQDQSAQSVATLAAAAATSGVTGTVAPGTVVHGVSVSNFVPLGTAQFKVQASLQSGLPVVVKSPDINTLYGNMPAGYWTAMQTYSSYSVTPDSSGSGFTIATLDSNGNVIKSAHFTGADNLFGTLTNQTQNFTSLDLQTQALFTAANDARNNPQVQQAVNLPAIANTVYGIITPPTQVYLIDRWGKTVSGVSTAAISTQGEANFIQSMFPGSTISIVNIGGYFPSVTPVGSYYDVRIITLPDGTQYNVGGLMTSFYQTGGINSLSSLPGFSMSAAQAAIAQNPIIGTSAASSSASLTFVNINNPLNSIGFGPNDNWQITIVNATPNSPVYVDGGIRGKPGSQILLGMTDANGNYTDTLQSGFTNAEAGNWNVNVYVGNQQVGPSLNFTVNPGGTESPTVDLTNRTAVAAPAAAGGATNLTGTVANTAVGFTFVNLTSGNTKNFTVGDSWQITITGPTGATVTSKSNQGSGSPSLNGSQSYTIPPNGILQIPGPTPGVMTNAEIGSWTESWSVTLGGVTTTLPSINFNVAAASSAASATISSADASNFITNLYSTVLYRSPDPSGFGFWINALINASATQTPAQAEAQIQSQFKSSSGSEISALQGWIANSNSTIYSSLGSYQQQQVSNYLITNPTALNGQSYQTVTPGSIYAMFGNKGTSAASASISTANAQAYITGLYSTVLYRSPDDSGLSFWTNALVNASTNQSAAQAEAQIQTQFVASSVSEMAALQQRISTANTTIFSQLGSFQQQAVTNYISANPTALSSQNFQTFAPGSIYAVSLGMGSSTSLNSAAKSLGFTFYDSTQGLFTKQSSQSASGAGAGLGAVEGDSGVMSDTSGSGTGTGTGTGGGLGAVEGDSGVVADTGSSGTGTGNGTGSGAGSGLGAVEGDSGVIAETGSGTGSGSGSGSGLGVVAGDSGVVSDTGGSSGAGFGSGSGVGGGLGAVEGDSGVMSDLGGSGTGTGTGTGGGLGAVEGDSGVVAETGGGTGTGTGAGLGSVEGDSGVVLDTTGSGTGTGGVGSVEGDSGVVSDTGDSGTGGGLGTEGDSGVVADTGDSSNLTLDQLQNGTGTENSNSGEQADTGDSGNTLTLDQLQNTNTGGGGGVSVYGTTPYFNVVNPNAAYVGQSYNGLVQAYSIFPMTYSLVGGSLAPGLTLGSNGVISGIPTAVGNYTFTVEAKTSQGVTSSRQFLLTVNVGVSTQNGPVILDNLINQQPAFQGLQMPTGLQMPADYQVATNNPQQPANTQPSQVQGASMAATYTVKKGDTLWNIAKQFTGDGRNWRKILAVNPDCLSIPGNTKTLRIGFELNIPAISGAVQTAAVPQAKTKTTSPAKTKVSTTASKVVASTQNSNLLASAASSNSNNAAQNDQAVMPDNPAGPASSSGTGTGVLPIGAVEAD